MHATEAEATRLRAVIGLRKARPASMADRLRRATSNVKVEVEVEKREGAA
jgi:hypothetical protein